MYKLVLLRHGESTWNQENRFTGWTDVDLSEKGYREAAAAGRALRDSGYAFDIAYSSVLRRAIRTLWVVQETMDMLWLPVEKHWRLNERHYGALQGLNKAEIAEHYGAEQVHLWRRSYSVQPPALTASDPRHPRFDPRYRDLPKDALPATESLADTMQRVLQVWQDSIQPHLHTGKKILIVAHGNTLRALVKHLENVPDDEIAELNIPTGVPLVYEFDQTHRIMSHYYLHEDTGDAAAARLVMDQAAANPPH
ncbi:MAG: 2,3-diphosphoglycerate-dependent phosphoglycerate mutase [Hydrogenophilaceae bacterium]|nr:2,3-diphosphoglycerate-dependent phosphoglycerate mutase [Hydrogenophilaceae bacterium]